MAKKIIAMMTAIVFMFSSLSGVTATTVYAAAGDEQLNRTSIVLIVNKKNDIFGTAYYGSATLRVLNSTGAPTFKSSNKKIATVGTNGVVTAVKAGKCNIKVKIGKKTYTCKVTVKNAYSTKSLKKNLTLSKKVENGIVKFTIVNKYNHPMFIFVEGTEIKADGSNSSMFFNTTVPAKATTYVYKTMSAPTSDFIFTKRCFSYTNGAGVARSISNKHSYYPDYYSEKDCLTFSSSKLGFNITDVRVEPYKGWLSSEIRVKIDGDFHNNTPISLSSECRAIASAYILFYNEGKPVNVAEVSATDFNGLSGIGELSIENMTIEKIKDWDGVFDDYKIVVNSKSMMWY